MTIEAINFCITFFGTASFMFFLLGGIHLYCAEKRASQIQRALNGHSMSYAGAEDEVRKIMNELVRRVPQVCPVMQAEGKNNPAMKWIRRYLKCNLVLPYELITLVQVLTQVGLRIELVPLEPKEEDEDW